MKRQVSMRLFLARCAIALLLAAGGSPAAGQVNGRAGGAERDRERDQEGLRLPNGKLQREEILKAEHEQNLKDAARISELSEELKQELEKNDRYVVSMSTLKKTDEIEKLAKKIGSRLRHN
jgi:hypothetical protein